jgi:hypothetical protein
MLPCVQGADGILQANDHITIRLVKILSQHSDSECCYSVLSDNKKKIDSFEVILCLKQSIFVINLRNQLSI